MTLKQLRYFIAVAEELHFGRAAQRLSISQPPLSFNIARLEEALGYRLLDRSSRKVELTAAGKVFYSEACRILRVVEQARLLGSRASIGQSGSIRIGFVGTAIFSPISEALRQFDLEHPNTLISVHELNSFEQIDALQGNQIDFGILYQRSIPDSLNFQILYREPFVCALPAPHPVAQKKSIHLRSLKDESFVLPPRYFSSEYHNRIMSMCIKEGFTPHIRYEARTNAIATVLVAAGFGVAIVPASISRIAIDGLCFRPLANTSVQSELIGVWRKGNHEKLIQPLLTKLAALLA